MKTFQKYQRIAAGLFFFLITALVLSIQAPAQVSRATGGLGISPNLVAAGAVYDNTLVGGALGPAYAVKLVSGVTYYVATPVNGNDGGLTDSGTSIGPYTTTTFTVGSTGTYYLLGNTNATQVKSTVQVYSTNPVGLGADLTANNATFGAACVQSLNVAGSLTGGGIPSLSVANNWTGANTYSSPVELKPPTLVGTGTISLTNVGPGKVYYAYAGTAGAFNSLKVGYNILADANNAQSVVVQVVSGTKCAVMFFNGAPAGYTNSTWHIYGNATLDDDVTPTYQGGIGQDGSFGVQGFIGPANSGGIFWFNYTNSFVANVLNETDGPHWTLSSSYGVGIISASVYAPNYSLDVTSNGVVSIPAGANIGTLTVTNATNSTPVTTASVNRWMTLTNNGVQYFVPLYK